MILLLHTYIYIYTHVCMHPQKLACPLKDDGWKTIFLLEMVPFQRTTSLVVVGETN